MRSTEGCVILSVDESQNDRHVREILAGAGDFISESSMEIPVDDFGVLKMIPLDSFRDEVEPYDPRDNGYAAKLQSFFVHDGERFFFLPLDDVSGGLSAFRISKLRKQVASLLEGVPFTFTVFGQGSAPFLYFILLAAACIGALYFSHTPRLFAFELPVLLAFGWCGPSAFVLAAILSGIWELCREPLIELSAARRYKRGYKDYAGAGLRGLWERLKPFKINCLLVLLLLLIYTVYSVTGKLSPLPVIAGCLCFFLLYFFSLKADAGRVRKSRHVPFTPVPLFPYRTRTFSLSPLLLPFAVVSVFALALSLVFPGGNFGLRRQDAPPIDPAYLVSSEDHNRYFAFQNSFSYTSMDHWSNDGEGLNQEGYLRYYLGADGLIAGGTDYARRSDAESSLPGRRLAGNGETVAPPFPLEKLMGFLLHYQISSGAKPATGSIFNLRDWISVIIILTASTFNFIRPGIRPLMGRKKRKLPAFRDKRIAA